MIFDFKREPGLERKNRYDISQLKAPLISIITPYYNANKHIKQTMNCVLNQTFPWFEWIIIDDGSTLEKDKKIVDQLQSEDCRIRLFRIQNCGAAGARLYGVERSLSDIIVFLDADDLIDERFLEYMYWALQRNPDAQWAFSNSLGFGDIEYLWAPDFSSERMKKENILPYCSAIRKSIILSAGLYDSNNRNEWEDYQLWLKMLARRHYPVHVDQTLFWYRRDGGGELSKINKDPSLKRMLRHKIKRLAKDVPDGIQAITFRGRRLKEFIKPQKWAFERRLPFGDSKVRILMLLPHMECGGADKFNLDVLRSIDKSKYEIGIITTVPADCEWRQEFTKYADDIFELPSFLDLNDWAGFIHYFIQTRNIQILWNISSYFGYYTLPWLRIGFPELAIIDCVHAEGRYWRNGGYPRVSAAMDSILDKTYITNDYTRNVLIEKYGKARDNTKVIYTGVDDTEFIFDRAVGESIRKQHVITSDRPIVLYICRMSPEKRPFLMLEIALAVRRKIPDISFFAVGGGPQLYELKKESARKGLDNTVCFTGFVEDVKPYYYAGDVFLLCSIKEGLSITTLEAMLTGIPVISADVASQYEVVDDTTGILVPCLQDEETDFDSRIFSEKEIGEYSDAICTLLHDADRRNQMKLACREKVLNGFTLNVLMKTLEDEFSDLCSEHSIAQRKYRANLLSEFSDLTLELLVTHSEYESIQLDFRASYKLLQYLKEILTFRRSPFSIYKEIRTRYKSTIIKRLLQSIRK